MKLLRVGDCIINMDMVAEIQVERDSVHFMFPVRQEDGGMYMQHFTGDDAAALQNWLEQNATRCRSRKPGLLSSL
jgi:hypothetical protein